MQTLLILSAINMSCKCFFGINILTLDHCKAPPCKAEKGSFVVRKAEWGSLTFKSHSPLNCSEQHSVTLGGRWSKGDIYSEPKTSPVSEMRLSSEDVCSWEKEKVFARRRQSASFLPNKSTWAVSLQLIRICPWFALNSENLKKTSVTNYWWRRMAPVASL